MQDFTNRVCQCVGILLDDLFTNFKVNICVARMRASWRILTMCPASSTTLVDLTLLPAEASLSESRMISGLKNNAIMSALALLYGGIAEELT